MLCPTESDAARSNPSDRPTGARRGDVDGEPNRQCRGSRVACSIDEGGAEVIRAVERRRAAPVHDVAERRTLRRRLGPHQTRRLRGLQRRVAVEDFGREEGHRHRRADPRAVDDAQRVAGEVRLEAQRGRTVDDLRGGEVEHHARVQRALGDVAGDVDRAKPERVRALVIFGHGPVAECRAVFGGQRHPGPAPSHRAMGIVRAHDVRAKRDCELGCARREKRHQSESAHSSGILATRRHNKKPGRAHHRR